MKKIQTNQLIAIKRSENAGHFQQPRSKFLETSFISFSTRDPFYDLNIKNVHGK
jgi:hypothetical protein